MEILIFFIAHWYVSLFCQTFFYHRYAAHKMFSMSSFWEKVFYLLSYISQGSSYLSPRAYGILHRMHHANPDTVKDPHSPKYDKNIWKMMWKTKKIYNSIYYNKLDFDKNLEKGVPDWKAMDKIGAFWLSRIVFGTIYTIFYCFLAHEWSMF